MKRNKNGQFAKNDDPVCPNCREMMNEVWDNVGFDGFDGPSKWEVIGYKCPHCGHKED